MTLLGLLIDSASGDYLWRAIQIHSSSSSSSSSLQTCCHFITIWHNRASQALCYRRQTVLKTLFMSSSWSLVSSIDWRIIDWRMAGLRTAAMSLQNWCLFVTQRPARLTLNRKIPARSRRRRLDELHAQLRTGERRRLSAMQHGSAWRGSPQLCRAARWPVVMSLSGRDTKIPSY